jgi:hypothetical protein
MEKSLLWLVLGAVELAATGAAVQVVVLLG